MDNATSLIAQQVPIGLVLVFVQNWLKKQPWIPWLNYDSPKVNHIVAIVGSALATLGIHVSYSATEHTLLVSGLAWATVASGAWHCLQQYAISKGLYTGLAAQLNPPAAQQPKAVVETANIQASSLTSAAEISTVKPKYDPS